MSFLPLGTTVRLGGPLVVGTAFCVDVWFANMDVHPARIMCCIKEDSEIVPGNRFGLKAPVDRMIFRRLNGQYVIVPDVPKAWACLDVTKEKS